MNYNQLIAIGIKIFGIDPDKKFANIKELLREAARNFTRREYESGLSIFAEKMACYCDKNQVN